MATAELDRALETSVRRPRRSLGRRLALGCLAGLIVAGLVEAYQILFGLNFHAVIPGQVYRCAQPSPADLERFIKAHGIRTIVNLRGHCYPSAVYLDECRTAQRLDIDQEDVRLSAGRIPPVQEIRHLVEVLDRAEKPLLIHCRRGADRTGLVSGLAALLKTDGTLEEGIAQLGLRYGHLALGRPANLDRFFDLYQTWLAEQQEKHSPAVFRRWLANYCPGECQCRCEPLDLPTVLPRGLSSAIHVRFHNTSVKSWRFRPGNNAGIHAVAYLFSEAKTSSAPAAPDCSKPKSRRARAST